MFSPLQIGRPSSAVAYYGQAWNTFTLPDVTIWSFPGQHHEIKHKNPTRDRCFGLEVYRFDALLAFANETRQDVLYTIHNHDLSGGRDGQWNDIAHWFTAEVRSLETKQRRKTANASYINGQRHESVPTYYWDIGLWSSLDGYWQEVYH